MGANVILGLMVAASVGLGLLRLDRSPLPVPGAARVVKLDFWNGFTGPDGRVMLGMIRDFNRANPRVPEVVEARPDELAGDERVVV